MNTEEVPQRSFHVTYDVTEAWEEWTVSVPAHFTDEQAKLAIKTWTDDVMMVCLNESGNTSMNPVEIDGKELDEVPTPK
jgi:hypothetical protein